MIVDDHPIVRQGLSQLIAEQPDLAVCGESDRGEGVVRMVASLRPDAMIVDLSLKDQSGLDLIKELSPSHPAIPILVLSIHDEALYAERALRAGAKGYIMKEVAAESVVHALRKVLAGEIFVGERTTAKLLNKALKAPNKAAGSMLEILSDRELEVFRLLGQGYSTRRIAERFERSIKTVEIYRANIKHKLGLRDAAELVHFAVRWGQQD